MKRLIIFLLLLFFGRASAQTEQPTLIIDFSKIESELDSISKNYYIKNIVYSDFNPLKNDLGDFIKNEDKRSNEFIFQKGFVYSPFYQNDFDIISKVNKNDLIQLTIKNKSRLMDIFIKSDRLIGIDQYLKLENLSFTEGNFFYDMNDKKIEPNMITVIDLSNIKCYQITRNDLGEILKKN